MKIRIKKPDPEAVTPMKAHPADAGFDLCATSRAIDDDGNAVTKDGRKRNEDTGEEIKNRWDMVEEFTLTITCGDDGIHCSTKSDAPVSTCAVVGALEMCKLMMYENRTPRSAPAPSGEESGPVSKRRALIEWTRKVCLADEPLPVRAVNALHTRGVVTLEDLLRYTRRPLREFRNLGRMTLDGICRYVGRRGCELGSLAPVWYERMSGCLALSDLSKRRSFASREEMIDWMARENARIIKEEEEGL